MLVLNECKWFVQKINAQQNKVVITDRMWARLLSSTNQPSFLPTKHSMEADKEEATAPTALLDDATAASEVTNNAVSI